MVPDLSIGFYSCGKTNSSKVVEFQTTSLGQTNGSTWSPIFSGSGSYASVFSACNTSASIACPSCIVVMTNQASGNRSSNPIIIIGAFSTFLISTVASTLGWFHRGRRSASSQNHEAKNLSHETNADYVSVDIKDPADDVEISSPKPAASPVAETKDGDTQEFIDTSPVHVFRDSKAKHDTNPSKPHSDSHQRHTVDVTGWPSEPQTLHSHAGSFAKWLTDILIILSSLAFLVYAILVRVYNGVPNNHVAAKRLSEVSILVRIPPERQS